jgi:hypothetical protein
VYTNADTAPGDSGAALIDEEDDSILGFARRRSGFGSKVGYSSWVWAWQVYMAHKLFKKESLGA